uniref:Uncharacterized protein n=1 Tax=Siphoviridae sp. ct7dP4 TaxID=2827787 RepID=A0A8S5TNN3_9CAUD|nr:MAG TPA: hypothetical protein [Siphoviridae sp. ct7dP4]DAS55748.1 MAG TPA: hypothetical protein [Caudoviricetes sp.]
MIFKQITKKQTLWIKRVCFWVCQFQKGSKRNRKYKTKNVVFTTF